VIPEIYFGTTYNLDLRTRAIMVNLTTRDEGVGLRYNVVQLIEHN